jgi:hypothetical protein
VVLSSKQMSRWMSSPWPSHRSHLCSRAHLTKSLLIMDPQALCSRLCLQCLQGPSHGQDHHLASPRTGQQIVNTGLVRGKQTWGMEGMGNQMPRLSEKNG